MLALVTQSGELTVRWHSLFAAFTPPTADAPVPSPWIASRSVRLDTLRVPATSGHVVAAWGGVLHVALTLHDWPGDDGGLEEHTIVCSLPQGVSARLLYA